MRMSSLFARTLRETPSDAVLPSHRLLLRSGMIQQMAAGIYSLMPLGLRVMHNIEAIVRDEMERIGGQELLMPVVQPADLWRESGRYQAAAPGAALARFQDRGDHNLVLAMTHEEAVTDLARRVVGSYRQLPLFVFHIQTKFRDEARSRGGLVRVREFLMKDGYSFHADMESLNAFYPEVYSAYERIFAHCGLEVKAVEAATSMMGGHSSHEFMLISEYGEDTLIQCPVCGYAANAEAAELAKGEPVQCDPLPLERVATPGVTAIEDLAQFLAIETRQTLKAVFFESESELVFALIRGDLDVNVSKLSAVLGGIALSPASAEALDAAGLVPGYASPCGIEQHGPRRVRVIGDDSIYTVANCVAGANVVGYHLRNVNVGRDFNVDMSADIAMAREGDVCPRCGARLRMVRGIELGHIFKLGTKYADAMGADYLDSEGRERALHMGCYGIGLGRLMAAIVEAHWDEHGIIWPPSVAPFDVHLLSLAARSAEVTQAADALYDQLRALGLAVLYDDRLERAGVKFNDADLMGVPVRITVSKRTVEQKGYEVKARWHDERRFVSATNLCSAIKEMLADEQPQAVE